MNEKDVEFGEVVYLHKTYENNSDMKVLSKSRLDRSKVIDMLCISYQDCCLHHLHARLQVPLGVDGMRIERGHDHHGL